MIETPPENLSQEELPLLPLREFVLFPYMVLPLFVARESSIAAVQDALAGDRLILLVAQRDPETEEPSSEDLYSVGTVAMVMRSLRMPDGRLKVMLQGLSKARIDAFVDKESSHWARVTTLPSEDGEDWCVESEALVRAVRTRVEELLPLKNLPPEVLSITTNIDKAGRLADIVASNLRLRLPEAQEVLEVNDPLARLRKVDTLVRRELEVTTMQAEIQYQAKEEMSRGQREVFLREQLRAIQNELGEVDPRGEESDEYRFKVEEAGLSAEALEESLRQLRRLERMHPDGPEAQVVRNYLDWIVDLPWSTTSPDRLDLENARTILDADHAHLDGVKERILEFLGVRKLRQDSRGPILCFVGPPGVGKTSLGRSIARSMGREFVRISLGGVRDEAEVRGHRRTYVGALPGRIIQALKTAGTNNPVFMLDELDKLGADYRGDPSSALLEVLDPEQNSKFSDHFLSVPFDLSKVLFIATANALDPIPGPLRDRMEIIRLSGYTPEEKSAIASRFLIPRQTAEHGLLPSQVDWSSGAVDKICNGYTQEAGVRNLERQVAQVCRKIARQTAEGNTDVTKVTTRNLKNYLGAERYQGEGRGDRSEVGVANGLAWTEAGGEMLTIEATLTSGEGLILTGQLGDVMKESVQTALSFARSILCDLGLDERCLTANQVHVHVPAGATPKDGPSAGVTMATALLSLATNNPIRSDVAMTGEVTLRGHVLPVGGIREKALAALRQGITKVIVPASCMAEVEEIPKELKRKLTFVPVKSMREVLDASLESPLVWRSSEAGPPIVAHSSGPVASVKGS
ncbi:MAG: endopeptidase La [Myxococcota bacterium]|jgi:ATP-dependent Lon protease|nr:endopeptidase La [Myxococcota bacterium]